MKANTQTAVSKIQQDFQAIDVFDDLDFRVEAISNRVLQIVLDYMEANNMTRKKLATLIGTSPGYITQLFNNTRTLNFVTIAKIEQALNVRFDVKLNDLSSKQNLINTPSDLKGINANITNSSKPVEAIKEQFPQHAPSSKTSFKIA